MSQFSAKVLLKKSFTKDMNGNPAKTLFSNESSIEKIKAENKFLNSKVFQLENTSNYLASQYEQTLHGYQLVYQTNVNLIQKVEKGGGGKSIKSP
jgi:archaellum component FlaC